MYAAAIIPLVELRKMLETAERLAKKNDVADVFVVLSCEDSQPDELTFAIDEPGGCLDARVCKMLECGGPETNAFSADRRCY